MIFYLKKQSWSWNHRTFLLERNLCILY